MASKNGTIWKIVTIVITLIILAGGIIYGYASLEHQVADNTDMQPEVKQNTEHRHRFEEKVNNIETTQQQILTIQQQILVEVRK